MHPVVAAVAGRMEDLLRSQEVRGDPARFFLGTYLRTTRAVGEALDAGSFEDPTWVAAWDVDFAGIYLDALEAWHEDTRLVGARGGWPSAPTRRSGRRRTSCWA